MNKISIDTGFYDLKIENSQEYFLEILNPNTTINIEILENAKVNLGILQKDSNINLSFSLGKNSSLILNQLLINSSNSVTVNQKENSYLNYVNSVLTLKDSLNEIKIIQEEKSCFSSMNFNGINLSNVKLHCIINGVVKKEASMTTLSENSQIINFQNGNSKIIPNLIVDNYEVSASHSAYIGTLGDEEIFYLNSRGLTTLMAKELLLKSVLLSKIDFKYQDIFLNEIKNEINIK